jgi:outer membrane protein OmpA-like peptidoglycan-associated protein
MFRFRHTASVLLASGVLTAGVAFSQTPPNPTQQPVAATQGQVPIFRITVVGRTTPAINYRPRSGDTKIDFSGTTLMPKAKGEATISGEKGYIRIDAHFGKMASASQFGREYLTYVLWAITPEGRATNLGEIQVGGDDAKLDVTTQLQAFGLIVTAEPYFAVTQPSDVVVIENVVREGTKGTIEVVEAKYELLKRGSYLMNQAVAKLKLEPLEPGSSLDLAEARNAVELARVAGADRFATETFDKAARLLATAEDAKTRKQGSNAIMMPARQAAQTAEDARIIALQRQEDAYQAERKRLGLAREQGATDRALAAEALRRQAELDTQTAATARAAAERDKANADASRLTAERDKATADAARVAAERDKAGADAARVAAERNKAGADAARVAAERDKAGADAARVAAERDKAGADAARVAAERDKAGADAARVAAETAQRQAEAARLAAEAQARGAAAQSEQDKAALREQLRVQLNLILETRETARGLVVNLSGVLFDTGSANLKPGAREKLARVSGILVSHAGLHIAIEGHTDSVGAEDYNQKLSERRAESVRAYLVQQGISSTAVVAAGFGEGTPVATNATAAGRQQNRRVELVVSGDLIGRK